MLQHPDFGNSRQKREEIAEFCRQLILGKLPERGLFLRSFSQREIHTLVTCCHCRSRDWSRHRIVLSQKQKDVDLSSVLQAYVSRSAFEKTVVFIWSGDSGDDPAGFNSASDRKDPLLNLPKGIHDNIAISNSIIHLNATVHRNTCLENTYVGKNALAVNCGTISCCEGKNPFALANSFTVSVGAESGGGRPLNLSLEATMSDVASQLVRSNREGFSPSTPSEAPAMTVIGDHAVVCDTPAIDSAFLFPGSSIRGASSVLSAVLLPGASIRTSSSVQNVLLQWNASIVSSSTVQNSILMEECHAGPQSFIVSSVLGPDVHVSAGEIHASVLGPNTNAHHQSLLIGVLWPLGRGNVGYGANVGSNHTGRIPDQECTTGEGTFWGLSTVVKFPVDLSQAPYSIVAAGTSLAPQRIVMPFSLIVSAAGGEVDIIPGWLLKSSPYTLARSEKKYKTRRKALRHASYTGWRIIRASTVELCYLARALLLENNSARVGACRLSERAKQAGVVAYTECIQRFALHGLLRYVVENGGRNVDLHRLSMLISSCKPLNFARQVDWPSFPWDARDDADWKLQQFLLRKEFPTRKGARPKEWLHEHLRKLVSLEKVHTERIWRSKSRDDARGRETVPGYAQFHVAADNDPVIVEARAELQRLEDTVQSILQDSIATSKL